MKSIFTTCIPALAIAMAAPLALAQDPFVRGNAPPPAEVQAPPALSMTYEVFSLPLAEAAALLRRDLEDAATHKELIARVAKNEAKQEAMALIRGQSGQRVNADGVSEWIIPTEFEPTLKSDASKPAPSSPAMPSAFETHTCGLILEFEPTLSQDQQRVTLRLAPTHRTLTGREKWGQGISEIETPVLDEQSINCVANSDVGSPCLIGTMTPPPGLKPDDKAPKRVWLAFATVDLVRR